VISRIIKVKVWVINRSRRLRIITLTKPLIIIDITKIESNNCVIIYLNEKNGYRAFACSLRESNTKHFVCLITSYLD